MFFISLLIPNAGCCSRRSGEMERGLLLTLLYVFSTNLVPYPHYIRISSSLFFAQLFHTFFCTYICRAGASLIHVKSGSAIMPHTCQRDRQATLHLPEHPLRWSQYGSAIHYNSFERLNTASCVSMGVGMFLLHRWCDYGCRMLKVVWRSLSHLICKEYPTVDLLFWRVILGV